MRRWLGLSIVVFLTTIGWLAVRGEVLVTPSGGARFTFHVWPGPHSSSYWHRHIGQYLRFYANASAG